MTVVRQPPDHKHDEIEQDRGRPPACALCGADTWWDGVRYVCSVRKNGDAIESGGEEVRRRARCPKKECPRRSFTVYTEDAYPHRGFRLEVVASAVAARLDGELRCEVAVQHECSGSSVGRWVRWTETLVGDVKDLARACHRLCDGGALGAAPIEGTPRAAGVMHLLDRFADVLVARGVELPQAKAAGLVRLLVYLLHRTGEVFWLTKSSPPLRAQMEAICV